MAEHEFVINFRVNNQQAQAAKQEEVSGFKAVEAAAVQAANKAVQASNQQAAAQKQNVAQVLSAQQIAAKAREELIARENKRAVQAAADALDAAKQAEKAKQDAVRATAEAQRKASEDLKRQAKEAAEAQKQAARDAADAQKQAASQAKQAARDAAAAQKAAAQEATKWASAGQSVASTMLGIVGTLGGVTSLAGAASAVAGQFERISAQAREAANAVGDYRSELRELASIKGSSSVDAATVQAELGFRSRTLQSRGDATRMQESALGLAAVAVGPQGKIGQDDFSTFMESAGQLQVAKNVDASAMGSLAGSMVLNAKGPTNSDTLKRQLLAQFKAADLGAMSPGPFAEAFAKGAPMVGSGDYASLSDLTAMISGLSYGGKDTVNERLRQLTRMTRGSLGDVTKPPGANIAPADYYKGLGVNDQMDTRAILERMAQDVAVKEKASPGKFSLETYLRGNGFGSTEDIGAFKQYMQYRGQINDVLLPAANALPTTEQANAQLGEFRSTALGFRQQADLAADAAKVTQGIGAPEFVEAYKKDLFSRLTTRDQGKLWGWGGSYEGSQSWYNAPSFHAEMVEDLRKKGTAVGLPWQTTMVSNGAGEYLEDPLAGTTSNEQFGQLFSQISQRGGSIMGSQEALELLKRQTEAATKMEKSLQQIADQTVKPKVLAVAPKPQVLGLAP